MPAKRLPRVNLILLLISFFTGGTPFHQPVAQTQDAGGLKSPRLLQIQNEIKAGKQDAVESFWQDVVGKGTPLVEPIPGNNHEVFVTFLWREEKETRVIVSTDFAKSVQEMQLVIGFV